MARVAINTGASANDGTGDNLRAAGGILNNNFLELYTYLGAGSTTILSAPLWSSTNAGINTLSKVGIGTTNPRFALEVGAVGASGTTLFVNGDARVTGIVTIGPASITLNGITNIINVGTGITINGSTGIISATAIVLGGTTLTGAGSSQFVTTAAGIHTLSNVGIGTTNPTSKLTVSGDVKVTGNLITSGISTFSGPIYEGVTDSFNTSLTPSSGTLTISTLNSSIVVGALTTSITTWAFTGVNTTNGRAISISMIIDSNSLYTYGDACSVNGIGVTNGVRWAGGLAPTATNNEDILSFNIVIDNSATIRVYGSSALNYS